MASLFSRIAAGEIPCHKIAEDERFLAFLDIMPLAVGHVLVIPKKEIDYIFDIDDDTYQALWLFAKKIVKPLKKAIPCKRIGVAVIGLEVPHAHIHLIPLQHVGDINFEKPKMKVSDEELAAVAEKIRKQMAV